MSLLLLFAESGVSDAQVKFYDGAAFTQAPLKRYDGATFVPIPADKLKRWNGSSWETAG